MPAEYTIIAAVAVAAVVALEICVLRTGLLREARYWGAVAIVLVFQVPVDGWLTRSNAPIVSYRAAATSGIRWPFNIPIEDFGFGFALVTFTLLVWRCQQRRRRVGDA